MATYEFTVVASGLDHNADDFEDRFFEAGCDDATIAFSRGAILLHFARDAESLEQAVESAIIDVKQTGASVDRVEPDYLVSLSEIAERAHLTKGAVSHYANGARGKNFPHPVARVTTESPLWDFAEVVSWLHERNQVDKLVVLEASVLRTINTKLEFEVHQRVEHDNYAEARLSA